MTTCNKCGNTGIREGAKRCGNCGEPLMQAGVGYGSPVSPVFLGGAAGATVPEGAQGGVANVGGAASTVMEGGRERQAATVHEGGGVVAGGGGGFGQGTRVQEDELKPLAGWFVVMRSQSLPAYAEIPLFKDRNVLGRDPAPGTYGSGAIPDPKASGQHVMVVGTDAGCQITDMASSNGTFVNDQKIHTAMLSKGDRVRVGKTHMVFVPMPQVDL